MYNNARAQQKFWDKETAPSGRRNTSVDPSACVILWVQYNKNIIINGFWVSWQTHFIRGEKYTRYTRVYNMRRYATSLPQKQLVRSYDRVYRVIISLAITFCDSARFGLKIIFFRNRSENRIFVGGILFLLCCTRDLYYCTRIIVVI